MTGMFCKHRLELVQQDMWPSWLPNCFLLWRYPASHASAPLGVWMALWLSLSTDWLQGAQGEKTRIYSIASPSPSTENSAIPLTETQEKGLGPPGTAWKTASTDQVGSRAGAEWAPLRQRSGLFNSHSSRIQLNVVTVGIYSVMLLEYWQAHRPVNRKQGKGRERQEHTERTLTEDKWTSI